VFNKRLLQRRGDGRLFHIVRLWNVDGNNENNYIMATTILLQMLSVVLIHRYSDDPQWL